MSKQINNLPIGGTKIKWETGMVPLKVELNDKLAMGMLFQVDMTICWRPILRENCASSAVPNDAYY